VLGEHRAALRGRLLGLLFLGSGASSAVSCGARGGRGGVGAFASRSATPFWIATAHSTASTAPGNSTSAPSPISLTTRPRYSTISGSMNSLRSAFKRAIVASLVRPYQPAVGDNICGQYRRKLAFDARGDGGSLR
jgi:hypothetical protein